MDTPGKWAVCCMAALILSRINDVWILHEVPDLFSFKGALGQLPYFFVGVASFEHAALSRDVDSCLVPAAGIEVAQPFFCLDRQLCVQYLSFSWFRYFRRADYTENDGD